MKQPGYKHFDFSQALEGTYRSEQQATNVVPQAKTVKESHAVCKPQPKLVYLQKKSGYDIDIDDTMFENLGVKVPITPLVHRQVIEEIKVLASESKHTGTQKLEDLGVC